ncbi:hypothetical protein PIB30_049514 [Stylosanthes scabra]|uniref:Uncharacterized protein n=1 Tax=Stylosanthes scabra TaxID=79078 RepID=A0ABU6UGR1_9FABA|nr:hypothetical protein [Stylosanthes scabra]
MPEVDRLVGSDDEDWPWDDSNEEDEEESDEKEEDVEEKCEKEEVAINHEEESKTAEECGRLCIATVSEEDLGPLKKTKDVFTRADLGIVSIHGIAKNVLVKIGSLTVPTDFHIRRATKDSKGGNVEETFHPVRPPASSKKNVHQLDHGERLVAKRVKTIGDKPRKSTHTPPQTKKKKKDPMKRIEKAKNREEGGSKGKVKEEKARRKIELKCASVDDMINKLKAFKGALHKNKKLNTHLVQDHSK